MRSTFGVLMKIDWGGPFYLCEVWRVAQVVGEDKRMLGAFASAA